MYIGVRTVILPSKLQQFHQRIFIRHEHSQWSMIGISSDEEKQSAAKP